MHLRPPPPLVELLARLQLVDESAWHALVPYVRALATGLPAFESVWIDALRQARLLTQFQAAVLHRGHGDSLLIDRYVLFEETDNCCYADGYRGRLLGGDTDMRLTLFAVDERRTTSVATALHKLAVAHGKLPRDSAFAVHEASVTGSSAWAAGPWADGLSAAAWILRRGRFDPQTVPEIARIMVADLAQLEAAGLVHGDISVHSLILLNDGRVAMPQAGLRGIARACEGFAHRGIRPEACDGLSPQRVAEGTPPSIADDIYACGCVWWHLLCGRGAFGGGDSLSRMQAAHDAKIRPVREYAGDVPEPLNSVLTACLQPDPAVRPQSFEQLSEKLGQSTRRGRQRIVTAIGERGGRTALVPRIARRRKRRLTPASVATSASLLTLAFVALAWPIWVAMTRPHGIRAVAQSPVFVQTKTAAEAKPILKMSDNRVVPASYQASIVDMDLTIPSTPPVSCRDIRLRPGCKVCAARGERATIRIPRQGWTVPCEHVSFVNIDFVFESPSSAAITTSADCLLDLRADQIEFQGCTFRGDRAGAAVIWYPAASKQDSALALPSGRLNVRNSVFENLGCGIWLSRPGAATIDLGNVLFLGGGPCLTIAHCPAGDEPLHLSLFAVTLRESSGLMSMKFPAPAKPPGEIAVDATSCVFALHAGAPLIEFETRDSPDAILRTLKWTGQGSLLSAQTPFSQWRPTLEDRRLLDDAAVSVAGLVHDNVQFAGPLADGVAGSRVTGWQAPLQTPDAPGALIEQLPGKGKLPSASARGGTTQ